MRAIPILSIVASLHCLLFGWLGRMRICSLALLGFQAAIIIFVVHIRTPTLWQVCTIAIACGIAIASKVLNRRVRLLSKQALRLWLAPLIFVALGYGFLVAYRDFAFPVAFQHGEGIKTRVVWANIFDGLAFNPVLAKRYNLYIDDVSLIRATGVYLLKHGREADWVAMGGTEPSIGALQLMPYDLAVRDMLIDCCVDSPMECLKTVLWYKPVVLISTLNWIYGLQNLPSVNVFVSPDVGDFLEVQVIDATRQLDKFGLRANPFGVFTLLLLPYALLLIYRPRRENRWTLFSVGILAAGSVTPSLIGFPAPHTVADAAIVLAMLLQVVLIVAVASLPGISTGWSAFRK